MNGVSLTSKPINVRDSAENYTSLLGKTTEVLTDTTNEAIDNSNCLTDNFFESDYASTLERPVVYNPRHPYDNRCRIAQPQLHVGIQAIPQLAPINSAENFQLTAAYFEVSYELDVDIFFQSEYTNSHIALRPNKVLYYNNVGKGYTSGNTFAGVDDDWKRSTIEADRATLARQREPHVYNLRKRVDLPQHHQRQTISTERTQLDRNGKALVGTIRRGVKEISIGGERKERKKSGEKCKSKSGNNNEESDEDYEKL